MPALNNIRVENVCEKNRELLEDFGSHELINPNGFIDLSPLELEQQKQIITKIIENEESNVITSKDNYKKLKYKAKSTSGFLLLALGLLLVALALIVTGLTLAHLLITSPIILFVLPTLFFGFGAAIIATTELVSNKKIYQLDTNVQTAKKIYKQVSTSLNQLTVSNEGDESDEEISNDFNQQIRGGISATIVKNKIGEPAASYTPNLSELLVNQGTFPKTITPTMPSHEDPENVYNRENIPSHSYN